MNQRKIIQVRRQRRQHHVRKRLFGTPERPRLAVFRSSKHIYAQVINDASGTTLASASTLDPEIRAQKSLRREQGGRGGRRPDDRRAGQAGRY